MSIEGNKRRCRYLRSDVEQLLQKKKLHRQPEKELQQALYGGMPLLTTRVSRIEQGELYYRERAISDLLETSFEDVIELLWLLPEAIVWKIVFLPKLKLSIQEQPFLLRAQMSLLLLSASDNMSHSLTAQRVTHTGLQVLNMVVMLACGKMITKSIAQTLQRGWRCSPKILSCLNTTLILCAEHELNSSTFTGRCIASTNANFYEVIIGALAAFSGSKHGGTYYQISDEFAAMLEQPKAYFQQHLRQGSLVGFHHTLYPQGDPRAKLLLAALSKCADPGRYKPIKKAVNFLQQEGFHPSVDFALVAMEYCLQLPKAAGLQLFIIGRIAGWVAHAFEQYQHDQQIRPRSGAY